jgi:hypothetical protein
VAGAIGRPSIAQAHDADDVRLGGSNTATTPTSIANLSTSSDVLELLSSTGVAVNGDSDSNFGLLGTSGSSFGVVGQSGSASKAGSAGWSTGDGTGVLGYSSALPLPSAKAKTGVYGYAAQDSNSRGVWGESPTGRAIQGTSSSGYAAYFSGKVYTTKFYELTEITPPASPGLNKARLFLKDNGSSKTQLCVKFANGTVTILATEG